MTITLGDINEYSVLRLKLIEPKKLILEILRDILNECNHIVSISGRVKSIESFNEKALKKDSKGELRYSNPLKDIHDQIGCRVVVRYLPIVKNIEKIVRGYFNHLEYEEKKPLTPCTFGYEASHFLFLIPPEIRNSNDLHIDFFELQIATVFQYAWAEANHDLLYKSNDDIPYEMQKYSALVAANSWSADKVFEILFNEYGSKN